MPDLEFPYVPRPQFEDFHQRQARWGAMVVHRRGGKTVACVNELLLRAIYTQKKNARFAYIAPFYRQAKDVAWQYIKEFGEGVITKTRESELRVELFNGAWISLYGADNPDALRGLYLDGVVLDEYGDCRPSLWGTVVLPTLADRKGWAVFIGTPKGKNHFYDVTERAKEADNWFYKCLPASQSGILDQEELDEMRAQMSEDAYRQELECDFTAAVIGTYYASIISEMEGDGRIALNACEHDPDQPVSVSADLGRNDNTAMWFWQSRPDGYALIDYYENSDLHISHYLTMLDDRGYDYENIYLPHDAKAKTLATGRSTAEQMLDHFQNTDTHVQVAPRLAVQQGIDAVRLILKSCYINAHSCKDGIEALRAYRRTYDEVNKCFSDKPKHDWASDGADAFRYFALACQPRAKVAIEAPAKPILETPRMQLSELFEANEQGGNKYKYSKLRM